MSPLRVSDAPASAPGSGRGRRDAETALGFDLWIEPGPGAPLGAVLLTLAEDGVLVEVRLNPRRPRHPLPAPPACLRRAAREASDQIQAYLAGRHRRFSVPYRLPPGVSPFSGAVLEVVARIPFGQVLGYGEVAARAGHERAARAVGGVMSRNPLPLVIPCHRVVGAQGRLGGFTGGLAIKRALLYHEGLRPGGARGPYR